MQPLAKCLEHLSLALEDEHVRTPHRADVQGLEACVQDEDLLHVEIVVERRAADVFSEALREGELEQMSVAMADGIAGWMEREIEARQHRKAYVDWYGGEPMLNQDVIERLSAPLPAAGNGN